MTSRVLAAVLVLSLVVGGVYLYSYSYHSGGIVWFSPDTLKFKTQSEVLLPSTRVPIFRSQTEYRQEPDKLVQFLVANGYWSRVEPETPRWIVTYHDNEQWRVARHPLFGHPYRWIEWTEKNPDLARVMWPRVLSLFRRGIAGGYPDHLAFLASQSATVDEFRDYVNNDPELQAKGIRLR